MVGTEALGEYTHKETGHTSPTINPGYVVAMEVQKAGRASPKPSSPDPEYRMVPRGTEKGRARKEEGTGNR